MKVVIFSMLMSFVVAVAQASTYYVAMSGDDGADGSESTPFATFAKAVSCCGNGDCVVLGKGTHDVSAEATLDCEITVRGATGVPEDVILKMNGEHRHFTLNNANAKIESITLVDGHVNGNQLDGGSVYIDTNGGVVSNCVFNGCQAKGGWGQCGGAVAIYGANGLVTHCVITNCTITDTGNASYDRYGTGMGVFMTAGNLRNCLIAGNYVTTTSTTRNRGGAVYLLGGTMDNCTVTGNRHDYCSGVRTSGKTAKVRNCIIAGNTVSALDATGYGDVWNGEPSDFVKCAAPVLINGSCSQIQSPMKNPEAGDYRPTGAAVDAGDRLDWMTEEATDLAGNPRVAGALPDLGCYETRESLARIVPSDTTGAGSLDVVFAVTPASSCTDGVTCYWDWNGDGSYEEESAGTVTKSFAVGRWRIGVKVVDNATKASEVLDSIAIHVAPVIICVSPTSLAPAVPYGSWDTAAATLPEALLEAEKGSTVVLSAEEHEIFLEYEITKSITIAGATGCPGDVVLHMRGAGRHFTLKDEGAVLASFTLSGGNFSGNAQSGGSVSLPAGGTVSNCIFTACKADGVWGESGGAVSMQGEKALITHCVFTNCTLTMSGNGSDDNYGSGIAVYMTAGSLRNCLFVDNSVTGSNVRNRGGVIYAIGGNVDNCTVTRNHHPWCSGIRAKQNAKVRNCLVVGNTSDNGEEMAVCLGTASCYDHCLGDADIAGWTCASASAVFRSFERGSYAIGYSSPARNVGVPLGWMTGATDLAGNKRVAGKLPDVGCYENQGGGMILLIK